MQVAVELKADLVIVQEPWVLPRGQDQTSVRSVSHPGFTQILPLGQFRPRTLVYVSRSFKPVVSLATSTPDDSDLLVIDITEGSTKIQLLNIYNEAD